MVYVYVLNETEFYSDLYEFENLTTAKKEIAEHICKYLKEHLQTCLDSNRNTTIVISIRNPIATEIFDIEEDINYAILSEVRIVHDNTSVTCRILEGVDR